MSEKQADQELYKSALQTIYTPEDNPRQACVKAIRVLNNDGTQSIRLHVETDGELEGKEPLEFTMDKLRNRILEITRYSVPFTGIEIQEMIGKVREFNQQSGIVLVKTNRLGWQLSKDGSYCGWTGASAYDMQGNRLVKDIYAKLPTSSGNLNDNLSFLKQYLPNHELPQAVFLYGIASVLAGYLGKNLLLNLSGKSSRGKTTLAKLVISLFAEPNNERLCKTFNVTLNKMTQNLDGLFGVAVLIDD